MADSFVVSAWRKRCPNTFKNPLSRIARYSFRAPTRFWCLPGEHIFNPRCLFLFLYHSTLLSSVAFFRPFKLYYFKKRKVYLSNVFFCLFQGVPKIYISILIIIIRYPFVSSLVIYSFSYSVNDRKNILFNVLY